MTTATKSKGNAKDRPSPTSPRRRPMSSRAFEVSMGFSVLGSSSRARGRPPGELSGASSSSGAGNAPGVDISPPDDAGVARPPHRTRQPATGKETLASHGHVEAVPAPALSPGLPASFEILAGRIRKSHGLYQELGVQSRELGRRRIEVARDTGQMLIDAKKQAPRQWVTSGVKEFGMKKRTARIYMQVAKNWDEVEAYMNAKRQRAAAFTLREILGHLAKPKVKPAGETETANETSPLPTSGPTAPTGDGPTTSVVKQASAKGPRAAGAGTGRSGPTIGDAPDQGVDPEDPVTLDRPEIEPGELTRAAGVGTEAGGPVDASSRATAKPRVARKVEDIEETRIVDGAGDGVVVNRLDQSREKLRAYLNSIRPIGSSSESDRAESRGLWEDTKPSREQAIKLMNARFAADLADCEKCLGSGLDRRGGPCGGCAATGLVLASEESRTPEPGGPDDDDPDAAQSGGRP